VAKGNGKAIVTEYSWQTNSCDPCPTPPLQDSDVATLGGDVLFGMGAPQPTPPGGPMGGRPGPMPGPGFGGGYYGGFSGAILTRLHARYDSTTLTDDIFFAAADAVVGGREFVVDDKGNLEKGAVPSSYGNNFQARYAIRHAWTGPIKCQNPRRGVWGGPPAGVAGSTSPTAATGLASAPRGAVQYATFVTRGSLEFQVSAAPGVVIAPASDAGAPTTDDAGAIATDDAGATAGEAGPSTVPSVQPSSGHGCGCEVPASGDGRANATYGLAGLAALGAVIARRRKG
jgi:MYXO-CTERM domain-containing protein